jgi:hypothetical protein
MVCPLCGVRKAKRACPALGVPGAATALGAPLGARQICPVCCGTKRLVEINCPSDCVYLASARSHPPAVVQRRQERDRAQLLPLLQGLTERQARLFLMLAALVSRHQSDALQKLVDDDVAQASEALAATLETAGRGIVYEHRPAALPAERLMTELKALVAEISREGGSGIERDAAVALRRIELAARESAKAQPGAAEFQQLLIRMLAGPAGPGTAEPADAPTAQASSLIIP